MNKIVCFLVLLAPTIVFSEDLRLCNKAMKEDRYETSIDLFNQCIKKGKLTNPTLSRTYRIMGIDSNHAKKYREAVKYYNKALSLNPKDSWDDYVNRGNTWSGMGEFKKAFDDYDRALEVKPSYNEAYYNRGIVYEKKGEVQKAKNEFSKAYKYGLRSGLLKNRLEVYGLLKKKNPPISIVDIRKLLKSEPKLGTTATLKDAKKVASVWNLGSQVCSAFVSSALTAHPDRDKIKSTKEVVLPNLGLKFSIPQLENTKETVVKVYLNDKSRGVTDHYIYLSKGALDRQFAAIVITELPAGWGKEQAFHAAATHEISLAEKTQTKIMFNLIDGNHGKSMEVLVYRRVGSFCFPTSGYELAEEKAEIQTIGVSRFSFIDGNLVTFSLIVEIPKGLDKNKSTLYAKEVMDGFWVRLTKI